MKTTFLLLFLFHLTLHATPTPIHGRSARWILRLGTGEHLAAGRAGTATGIAALPTKYQPVGAAVSLWHPQAGGPEKRRPVAVTTPGPTGGK